MAVTYQYVVDLARIPLNDADKTRYKDEILLKFANEGVLALVKRRPDLFIGSFSSLPTGSSTLADPLEVGDTYAQVVADWVTGRAEMTDDEHANSGRAELYVKLFGSEAPI